MLMYLEVVCVPLDTMMALVIVSASSDSMRPQVVGMPTRVIAGYAIRITTDGHTPNRVLSNGSFQQGWEAGS